MSVEGEEDEEQASAIDHSKKQRKSIASRKSWVDNASLSTAEKNKMEDIVENEIKEGKAERRENDERESKEESGENIKGYFSIEFPNYICPRSELKSKEAGVRIWLEKNRLKAANYPIIV